MANNKKKKENILKIGSDLTIDSIYCRDASIATDFGMIICNMGKAGRKLEPKAQKQFYLVNGEVSEE